jgi:type I restriction enzyme, R subunit
VLGKSIEKTGQPQSELVLAGRLIKIAKIVREDRERGKNLGLNVAEVAFYDALADNKSAVDLMGEPVLVQMAQELAGLIRQNATIDWNLRETVRAKMRAAMRRLLRKYKYPPDLQEKAIETVLKQAELLAEEWSQGA